MITKINNWGISSRAILTAIIPVVIFSLVFGAYINGERNQDLVRELTERGGLIATNLAMASEFSVATQNVDQIRGLVDSAMNQKDVIGIRVLDESGKQLFKRGSYDSKGKGDVSQYSANIVSTAIKSEITMFDDAVESGFEDRNLLLGTVEVYISNESYLIRQNSILAKTIAIILAGIIGSIGLAMLISSGVVKPVRDVIEVVSALTHGKLSERLPEGHGGELGLLKSGINKMAETIESSQVKLEYEVKEATVKLENKVNELKSKNIELDAARSEAMQAKDAKAEFLANMSHEIRTPLNAIIGFSRQLEKTQLSGVQEDYSNTINSAARQLLTVIDDILSFSKIESGHLTILKNEFRLRDCFENIVAMLSPSSNEKSIELVLLIGADVPDVVIGDSERLTQVVSNLVSNAIKFTSSGSVVVHVNTEDAAEAIKVAVTDSGCGINLDAQAKLFTPFYQENQKANIPYGGTGLGLIISKRLVNMMGGELSFTSEEGIGSEFFFSLPLDFITLHDCKIVDYKYRVFVIDGNTYSRRAIRNNLLHMGIQVFSVDRQAKLLNSMAQYSDDEYEAVVIVSLASGFTKESYIQQQHLGIRAHHSGKIIVISTDNSGLTKEHEDGNIQYIEKPVRLSTLQSIFEPLDYTSGDSLPYIPEYDFSDYKILVAEDNEFNQKYISGLLESFGLSVKCVSTGSKAVAACKNESFDMILMDLHMPELDGINATQLIRGLAGEYGGLPIIAITADVFANEENKLLKNGFTHCLYKPIDEAILMGYLREYLLSTADDNQAKIDLENTSSPVSITIPLDMQATLFSNLYTHFQELLEALNVHNIDQSREHIHTILGLVGYFKISSLSEEISRLQNAIKSEDIERALMLLTNAIERTKLLEMSVKK